MIPPSLPPRFLSDCVFQLLSQCNPLLASAWRTLYAEPADQSTANQIVCINRFWRDQLAHLSANTLRERESLVDIIVPQDWVRLFNENVLPTIIRYQLPVQRMVLPVPGQPPVWADIQNWSPDYAR